MLIAHFLFMHSFMVLSGIVIIQHGWYFPSNVSYRPFRWNSMVQLLTRYCPHFMCSIVFMLFPLNRIRQNHNRHRFRELRFFLCQRMLIHRLLFQWGV